MLERYICVRYDKRNVPTKQVARKIFQTYGSSKIVGLDWYSAWYFFVIFYNRRGALRCIKDSKTLYEKHRFFIEVIPDLYEDENIMEGVECSEPADPNLPSLMDLNEDCLITILSKLPFEFSIETVCRKLRRLYRDQLKKEKHLYMFRQAHCLDRVFNFGPQLTHLSVCNNLFPCAWPLILLRCRNLRYLRLQDLTLDLDFLRKIVPSLTELVLDPRYPMRRIHYRAVFGSITHLEKLRIDSSYHEDDVFELDVTNMFQSIFRKVTPKTLTTIIMEWIELEVGTILALFPTLHVLACRAGVSFNHFPERPVALRELFLDLENWFSFDDVAKLRQICPDLRHLRISMGPRLNSDAIVKLLPLDGLYLSKVVLDDFHFLPLISGHLKYFFLERCGQVPKDSFPVAVAQFPKLHFTSWDETVHGSLNEFLSHRSPTVPLTIFRGMRQSKHERKQETFDVRIMQDHQKTSIFGQFSIYSLSDHSY